MRRCRVARMNSKFISASGAEAIALARFSLISKVQELVAQRCRSKSPWKRSPRLRRWPAREGSPQPVAVRTLEDWWYAHQRGGFAALHPKGRSDRGVPRTLTPEQEQLIVAQVRAHPAIAIKVLYRRWKQEDPTLPSLYTIYRALTTP